MVAPASHAGGEACRRSGRKSVPSGSAVEELLLIKQINNAGCAFRQLYRELIGEKVAAWAKASSKYRRCCPRRVGFA